MSKIVLAVNAMINNPKLITNVTKSGDELFFLYKKKHKWSMARRDDMHYLWFYPEEGTLEQLLSRVENNWQDVTMVTYRDSEIGTREAEESFSELYKLIEEKLYGVNEVLDDIISDDDIL